MKKSLRFLSAALIFALLCGVTALPAGAKWLETCRLCNGKGDYHCEACGNTGKVTCDGCGGTGHWECPGEDGKGKCDHGYYVCPSCNGDGLSRPIPADGNAGPCGQCGGSGKLECWHCHGTGGGDCDRCGGTGLQDCQVGTCQVSRRYGWKCPDCKGTGYILVGNPMPPKSVNDGKANVPAKGDWIFTGDNGAYYVYGSAATPAPTATPAVTDAPTPTATARPTAAATDAPEPTAGPEPAASPADPSLVPGNRNSDFDVLSPEDPEHPAEASVRVEVGRMSEAQQRYYAGLTDAALAQVLDEVRGIVLSAEPGRFADGAERLIGDIAAQNGFETPAAGRIYPLYFEGHCEIGFPVRVTVRLAKGALDGGTDLYVYHVREDGGVELSGRADYGTYEDGSVAALSFDTASFSTFFTAAKELGPADGTSGEPAAEDMELVCVFTRRDGGVDGEGETENGGKANFPVIPVAIGAAAVCIAAIAVIAAAAKKRKARR